MITAGVMPTGDTIAQVLVSRFPELVGRVRSDGSPPRRPSSTAVLSDTQNAGPILGLVQYRRVEETLTDVAQQIVELQRRQNWRSVVQS
jgi:hypothetical protein